MSHVKKKLHNIIINNETTNFIVLSINYNKILFCV